MPRRPSSTVAYRRDQVAHPLDGFGVVVPAIEGRKILAVSFTSKKFPGRAPAGTVLLRVFVGGATQPDLYDLDDAAIEALVLDELSSLLGASGTPLLLRRGPPPPRDAAIHPRPPRPRRQRSATGWPGTTGSCSPATPSRASASPTSSAPGQDAADALLRALADPAAFAAA